ncbi:MAG: hypothetical protein FWF95_01850 [Syntrophorhabdaceae bacterium]|nr:hypothetical protein [Syntrophorhabdaceae bacterium]
MTRLIVIEPNLRGPAGHYAEFVRAVGTVAGEDPIDVYAHPDADGMLAAMAGARPWTAQPRVGRPLAEWKMIFRAVREEVPFLVLTADGRHAAAVSAAGICYKRAPRNACLFFHRPPDTGRDRLLLPFADLARKHALAVAATEEIARSLSDGGWKRVELVAYPALAAESLPAPAPFSRLLMAGAARLNKGLDLVAELALLWADQGRSIPLLVQVSKKHINRHGSREKAFVEALFASGYQGLRVSETAPDRLEYIERFRGALVLAPYARQQFASQVSGVVLDALLSGAPVIATSDTWPGRQVERFGAGVTIRERTAAALAEAIDRILSEWTIYSERACEAAGVLRREHDPIRLLKVLEEGTTRS